MEFQQFMQIPINQIPMLMVEEEIILDDGEFLVEEMVLDDEYEYMEEVLVEVPEIPRKKKKVPNRNKVKRRRYLLWEFLFAILQDDLTCPRFIHWVDISNGTFKIEDNKFVTKLYGILRDRPNMTYESFSRCLRYYYRKNILLKVKHLTFSFRKFPRKLRLISDQQTFMLELDKDEEEANPVEEVQPLSIEHPNLAEVVRIFLYKEQSKQKQKIQPKSIQITPDGRVAGLDIGIDCYGLLEDEEAPKAEPPKRVVKSGDIWFPPVGMWKTPKVVEKRKDRNTRNNGGDDEWLAEDESSKPTTKSKVKQNKLSRTRGRSKKKKEDDGVQLTVIIEKDVKSPNS